MSGLKCCIKRIRGEIALFNPRWLILEKRLAEDATSTSQLFPGGPANVPQSQRIYLITINQTNPLGYQLGLSEEDLIEIGTVHEQTHALCDLSYTCNQQQSRLGVWNTPLRTFDENCSQASEKLGLLAALWKQVDEDDDLPSEVKTVFTNRLSYGGKLIDIDPVVNELCMVADLLRLSEDSQTVIGLTALAEWNMAQRREGRMAEPAESFPPRPSYPAPQPPRQTE